MKTCLNRTSREAEKTLILSLTISYREKKPPILIEFLNDKALEDNHFVKEACSGGAIRIHKKIVKLQFIIHE